MEKLINHLLQFGQFKHWQIDLIKNNLIVIELKKEDYFSEAGKIARQVAFVEQGILRICYNNTRDSKNTRNFFSENDFAVDINSFMRQVPSAKYVQAVTDCKLFVFCPKTLYSLSNSEILFDAIAKQVNAKLVTEKLNRRNMLAIKSVKARYLCFLEQFPQLANRLPLSLLAPFIESTQWTVSRICKNIP